VPLPKDQVHRIRGEDGPERAAEEYERELRRYFGATGVPAFDLVILGAGSDGHTASLFRASDALASSDRIALPVHRTPPELSRLTLTLPVMDKAAHVLVLVSGPSKAMSSRRYSKRETQNSCRRVSYGR
jgi:6-phosphogluconolactonase